MDRTRIAERELSADEAQKRILAELRFLGLEPSIRTLGRKVVSVLASLGSNTHEPICGAGKGYPDQARIGALYEALEHYWTEDLSAKDIHFATAQYFTETKLFNDDSVLQLVCDQKDTWIACRTYKCPLQDTHFHYPIALTLPGYPERAFEQDNANYCALRRYSSNSGTAIGASYNEALLHATNECIERDAVSLFLLNHFYYENHPPLRRVARLRQSDILGRLWTDAEREIGAEIVLLEISNEFQARTFLAFPATPDTHISLYGTGCSLDPRHGAWRALTELVQLHHAVSQSQSQYRQHLINAQRHLQRFPRLLRCSQFHTPSLLSPQHSVVLPDAWDERPLTEQIDQLLQDLQRHGRTLGVTTLHQTALGTTLVNVIIPGLERFFIVSSGNVVIPQSRGRRLEKNRQATCA